MTVGDLQKANELIVFMSRNIEAQQDILNDVKDLLEEYQEFLTKQIEELR